MPARALAHVHQVQASLHIGGKLALQKIQHDTSRGRRLHILLADRSRWIHRHHMHPATPSLQRNLFRHELRSLVVANHIRQRNRRILVRRMPIVRESHRRHARCINNALHAGLPRRFQNRACAADVRPVHLLRIPHPEPVVSCHVKHRIAAAHRLFERGSVAQIASSGLRLQSLKILQIARRTNQQPQFCPLVGENARDMGTQKSSSACDESFQGIASRTNGLLVRVVLCPEKMQRDVWRITHNPTIVTRRAGWNEKKCACSEFVDGAVLHRSRRATGDHKTYMLHIATRRPHRRPDVNRPLPSWLVRGAADRHAPDPDDFELSLLERSHFVGLFKSLQNGVNRGHNHLRPSARESVICPPIPWPAEN